MIALVMPLAMVAACGDGAISDETPPRGDGAVAASAVIDLPGRDPELRLEGSRSSLDALGELVLASLVMEDVPSLESVRVTEHEHNEVLWPEMPASAPEVNFPVDYAWSNIENRSARGLARLLPLFAQRDIRFLRVECRGGIQSFETFAVETDCWIVFAQGASPELWQAQIFKDAVVRGGGYKIFRYYDEEPRRYTAS